MNEFDDPIVAEIRRIRDEHAAKFNYDPEAIFADIKELERQSGRKYVSFADKARKSSPIPAPLQTGTALPVSQDSKSLEPAPMAEPSQEIGGAPPAVRLNNQPMPEPMNESDPIVAEVRRIRDEHAAKFNYDLDAIFADIKERERLSGRTYVSFADEAKKSSPSPAPQQTGAAIPASQDSTS